MINSLKKRLTNYWSKLNLQNNNQENEENQLLVSHTAKNFLVKTKNIASRLLEQFYNTKEGLPSFWFIVSVYLFGRIFVGEVFFPETKLAMFIGFAFIGIAIYLSITFLPQRADSSQSNQEKEEATNCIVTSMDKKILVDSFAPKLSLNNSKQSWISEVGARVSLSGKKKRLWMSVSFALNVTRFDPPSKNKYEPEQIPSLVPHGLQDANAAKSLLKQTDMSLSENTRGAVLWIHDPIKNYTAKEWETYQTKLSSEINNRYFELNQAISTLFPRFEFIPYSPDQEEQEKSSLEKNDLLELKKKVDEIKKLDLELLPEKHEKPAEEIPTGGI
jgi:hypothetical protein